MRTRSILQLLLPALMLASSLYAGNPAYISPTSTGFTLYTGDAFSQKFTCVNCGSGPVTWQVVAGSLPAGVTLNTTTGVVSGTPTTVQNTTIRLAAYIPAISIGSFQAAVDSYSFNVYKHLVFLTSTPLAPATSGAAVTRNIQVSVTSLWDSSGSNLPTGVRLIFPPNGGDTATLSGTFPAVSTPTTYTFKLFASAIANTQESISQVYTIVVNPPPAISANFPTAEVTVPFNSSLTATGGTPPYAFSTGSGTPPGLLLNASTGVLTGAPTQAGTFAFTGIVTDANGATGTARFSITVLTALSINANPLPNGQTGVAYSALLTASGGVAPYTWSLAQGTLPAGLTFNPATQIISGTPTVAGTSQFIVRAVDANGAVSSVSLNLTINPPPLSITTTTLPSGSVGVTYGINLAATGGTTPYRWSVTTGSLPAGLTLAPAGVLSGTPTAGGTTTFTVTVQDAGNLSATQSYTLVIISALTLNGTLTGGVVGTPYSGTVSAAGGTPPYAITVSAGALPGGLTLSAAGAISGTPTANGTFSFTIQVADSANTTATKAFTVNIAPALAITQTTLPAGVRGTAYSAKVSATGGVPPYAFTLASGALPAGIALSSDGTISGTPTATGSFTPGILVTDSAKATASGTFPLVVNAPATAPVITTTTLPGGTVGSSYSATLAGTGMAPLTWSLATGALPDGLSLSSAGAITGVPTTVGSFAFSVRLSDGNQPVLDATQNFTINVVTPPLPSVSVTQIQDTTPSGSQPSFGVALGQAYPLDLNGTATISFAPAAGPVDPDIKFPNGQTTMNFVIPAGQPTPAGPFAFGAGTTAGTITITIVLSAGGQTLNPNPAATRTITVAKAAPVLTSVKMVTTATGINVLVIGYSNTRELTNSSFTFTSASGTTLQTSQFTVPVATAFQTWFTSTPSANFGGQFLLTVPFTLTNGAASSLTSVAVTLTNSVGTSPSMSGTF